MKQTTANPHRLAARLERLRREFDSSFALPWKPETATEKSLLCFTADGVRFALPLASLQSVSKAEALQNVPSRSPALLGFSVLRAQVIPVYSLGSLTTAPGREGECRWLALLRGPWPVALAIESLDGYATQAAVGDAPLDVGSRFVNGMVTFNQALYAVVNASELYEAITQPSPHLEKE